jgi:hypothetical protein
MAVAEYVRERKLKGQGGTKAMREVADNFMKLLAIIMLMITLAVSTAAVSQMLG